VARVSRQRLVLVERVALSITFNRHARGEGIIELTVLTCHLQTVSFVLLGEESFFAGMFTRYHDDQVSSFWQKLGFFGSLLVWLGDSMHPALIIKTVDYFYVPDRDSVWLVDTGTVMTMYTFGVKRA
jgi:hypothetical protein